MILNNYPQRSIDLLCCLILLRRNATQRGHFVNIFFDVHQTQRPLATHKACQGDVAAKGIFYSTINLEETILPLLVVILTKYIPFVKPPVSTILLEVNTFLEIKHCPCTFNISILLAVSQFTFTDDLAGLG